MRIELEVDAENPEATESPYWLILDPHQMMSPNYDDLASMITGPFFSREEAQRELTSRRYNYGKRAVVYCNSGYHAEQYKEAIRKAKRKVK